MITRREFTKAITMLSGVAPMLGASWHKLEAGIAGISKDGGKRFVVRHLGSNIDIGEFSWEGVKRVAVQRGWRLLAKDFGDRIEFVAARAK